MQLIRGLPQQSRITIIKSVTNKSQMKNIALEKNTRFCLYLTHSTNQNTAISVKHSSNTTLQCSQDPINTRSEAHDTIREH